MNTETNAVQLSASNFMQICGVPLVRHEPYEAGEPLPDYPNAVFFNEEDPTNPGTFVTVVATAFVGLSGERYLTAFFLAHGDADRDVANAISKILPGATVHPFAYEGSDTPHVAAFAQQAVADFLKNGPRYMSPSKPLWRPVYAESDTMGKQESLRPSRGGHHEFCWPSAASWPAHELDFDDKMRCSHLLGHDHCKATILCGEQYPMAMRV